MTVIAQDHDLIVNCKLEQLNLEAKYYESTFMGINVRHEQVNLGTYDNWREALLELIGIINCKQPIYVMGGFEDYD